VVVWFFAPLLLVSSGRTKQVGLLVLPIAVLGTLIRQIPGLPLGEAIPSIVLLLAAFAWFLFASLQSRREAAHPAGLAFSPGAAAPLS
jgi:hypothetical protein